MSAKQKEYLYAAVVAVFLCLLVDAFTNEMPTVRPHADFRNYELLFNQGLEAKGLQAPYAYRYVPAYLAKGIARVTGADMFQAFAWLSRIALWLFLWCLHFLVKQMGGSLKASFFVMAVVSSSFCHLKFIMFDPTRPDALGFLITLLAYLALERNRFWLLLACTLLGSQIREFTLIPFLIYAWRMLKAKDFSPRFIGGSALVVLSILLPRLLIDVSANLQFVPFNSSGLSKLIHRVVLNGYRHLNIVFVVLAYALPFLLLWAYRGFASMEWQFKKWGGYSALVLLLMFLGGTDLARFAAYLFIPLVILLTLNTQELNVWVLLAVVLSVFWFNKIGLRIPFEDAEAYRDFYGGVNDRINANTAVRWGQLLVLLVVFFALGWVQKKSRLNVGR